jgi:hypothetical protein
MKMPKYFNRKANENLGPYMKVVKQDVFTKAIQEIRQEKAYKKKKIRKPRRRQNDVNQKEKDTKKLLRKLKGKTSY